MHICKLPAIITTNINESLPKMLQKNHCYCHYCNTMCSLVFTLRKNHQKKALWQKIIQRYFADYGHLLYY